MTEHLNREERVVFITVNSEEEGARIAHALVEAGLAACVNIVRNVRSVYRWEGKVEDDAELLLIVKTRDGLVRELSDTVKKLHSNEVPEVISLPVSGGLEEYLSWISESTKE